MGVAPVDVVVELCGTVTVVAVVVVGGVVVALDDPAGPGTHCE